MSIEETRKRRQEKQAQAQEPQQAAPQIDAEALQPIIQQAIHAELQPIREQLKALHVSIDLLTMDVLNAIEVKANERQQEQEEEAEQNDDQPGPEDQTEYKEEAGQEPENQEEEPAPRQPIRPESPVQRLRPGPQAIPLGAIPTARVWIEPRHRQRRAQL